MKKCTWCGKEWPVAVTVCPVDGQPLSEETAAVQSHKPKPAAWVQAGPKLCSSKNAGNAGSIENSQWLDLCQIEDAFAWEEGYSRPDWKIIRQTIEQTVPQEYCSVAWAEAAFQWALQLRDDLGGDYTVNVSQEFVLLSSLEREASVRLLSFSESTLKRIYAALKESALQWGSGPHVILLFSDQEDYYQYISYYYRDGVHPGSWGCLIHKDYVHIALPYGTGSHVRATLVHELVHNSVVHLHLPAWLNEGLAMSFDRNAEEFQRHLLDGDLQQRHLAFWNASTIQKFWAGVAFHEAGEACQLSYSLAEILFHLLLSNRVDLPAFLKVARREDAAQTAAMDVLGVDLGQLAGTFLGPGEWRPNIKAISELWRRASPN